MTKEGAHARFPGARVLLSLLAVRPWMLALAIACAAACGGTPTTPSVLSQISGSATGSTATTSTLTFTNPPTGVALSAVATIDLVLENLPIGALANYSVSVDGQEKFNGASRTWRWNTLTVANGTHTLTARASANGGLLTGQAQRTVTVDNPSREFLLTSLSHTTTSIVAGIGRTTAGVVDPGVTRIRSTWNEGGTRCLDAALTSGGVTRTTTLRGAQQPLIGELPYSGGELTMTFKSCEPGEMTGLIEVYWTLP